DQVLHATDTLENLFNTLNEFKLLKPIVSSAVESFTRQDIESFFSVDKNKKKCKDDKKIGGISCENKKIFAKNIHKLVSHLLAENGGKTLFESFMRAFDPEVGVI